MASSLEPSTAWSTDDSDEEAHFREMVTLSLKKKRRDAMEAREAREAALEAEAEAAAEAEARSSTPPSSREPTLSEVIANLAAEPCIEPVSGDLAAALARLGIDVPRPAADEPERDSPPPRKRPTRPRRDAHVFPKRVGGGYRRGDGTPFARPPGRGDRPSATTVAPPPRAPRAPPRLAKAADADPPLEVASQEVIRLGEIRTRAHYGPWAHLWWGEVASADDRARSSAFASSSGSAASAAPFAVGFSVRTKLRRPESNSHARRTGTGPYGGRVVTRGVPVPEPRVAAVVECVVEERVVGKPWEGPTFRAAWRGGSRTGTRWTMGGPRRAPRVVEGVGTTPEAAVDALRAAVRRASRGVAAAAKLPPADVLFGFAPGPAARALARLTVLTGTPTRVPPGEGCGLALVRHASRSNFHDGDFASSSSWSSSWSSSLGECPLAPGYQTSFRLCAGVHARCRVVSREEANIGGASNSSGNSSGVAFVVERWDLGAVAARAVAADPDRAWAKMPEERRLAAAANESAGERAEWDARGFGAFLFGLESARVMRTLERHRAAAATGDAFLVAEAFLDGAAREPSNEFL